MNLESQVCSLELAKKLKELGIDQQSLFYWDIWDESSYAVNYIAYHCPNLEHYQAYTASEILDILPHYIATKENESFNVFRLKMEIFMYAYEEALIKFDKILMKRAYSFNYHGETFTPDKNSPFSQHYTLMGTIYDESLANAAAKMLIYLIKNNYYKINHN